MIAGKKEIGVYILIFLFFVLNNSEKSKTNKELIFKMVRRKGVLNISRLKLCFLVIRFLIWRTREQNVAYSPKIKSTGIAWTNIHVDG